MGSIPSVVMKRNYPLRASVDSMRCVRIEEYQLLMPNTC
jgi:hypothetical protein